MWEHLGVIFLKSESSPRSDVQSCSYRARVGAVQPASVQVHASRCCTVRRGGDRAQEITGRSRRRRTRKAVTVRGGHSGSALRGKFRAAAASAIVSAVLGP